jgi:hypothetical protein
MKSRFARAHREDGAALVLVLILVTVIALGLGALLTRSDTSIRATVGLRDQAAATYNADGAMQAAINNLRNSTYNHTAGQTCFSGTNAQDSGATLGLDNFYSDDSAAVTCSADPKRVRIQCPSLHDCNRPGNAILTLGNIPGEDGLNITQPVGSTFRVHGNVFSNSNINVVKGALNTNANVWARGACAGTIQSTPPPKCDYSDSNELGDDPGYVPFAPSMPVHQPMPKCETADSVVTFLPGYYDDAAALTNMMDGNGPCKHSTWWFTPGDYYFDFHNDGDNANPLLGGSNVWTIDDGYLVAGTPVDAAGKKLLSPTVPATIPGSCDNPIKNEGAAGVQFIFGGSSQLSVKQGKVEICGSYNVDKVPVAIYGLKSGAETTTEWTGADALKLDTVTTPSKFDPATVATLANTNEAPVAAASWKNVKKNGDTAVLEVSGFHPSTPIPAGSVLQSAVVRITHKHSDPAASTDSFSVSLTTGAGPALTGTTPGRPGGAAVPFQTDTVPLDVARDGALAKAVHDGTYDNSTIAVTTNLSAQNDIEYIDAIQLELSFTPPAFRAETGCLTHGPYTGTGNASTCALVTTENTNANLFYIQGTTYAPKAALDITLNNAAEQVFRFGVISRSLWLKETGSFSYTGVVIEVPDDSPGFVFSMYLSVYICPKSPTCSPGGSPVLRSKVALVDSDPTTPHAGARQVTILSWSRPG